MAHWQLYDTPRRDCTVLLKRWGDGVTCSWAVWCVIHQPTQIAAYVSFDGLVPYDDADALAEVFRALDRRVARANDDATQPVLVGRPPCLASHISRDSR